NFEGLSRAIEARHPRLIHQADPEIAVRVDLEIEGPFGMIGLLRGNREIRYFPGLRVELGQELFAEMRVPDHAVEIDDDVVWLDFLPRKIVFRDDDPRVARPAGRGAILGAKSCADCRLRLTLARYSASFSAMAGLTCGRRCSPTSRCGCRSEAPG